MKPTKDPTDKELYKLMQESRRKASSGFAEGVMQQLPAAQVALKQKTSQKGLPRYYYKPLLSWRALLTFLGTAGAISWLCSLLMAPATNQSFFSPSWLPAYRLPEFSLHLSATTNWLLLALLVALFLLAGVDRLLKRILN